MPRANPLEKIILPEDWREETLKILEIAACPKGSASAKIARSMLSRPEAEEAIKFLRHAAGEGTPLYATIVNQAFGACVIAKESERLRRKNASKSEATHKAIKRVFEDAMAIAETLPCNTFSIYDRVSLYPDLKKLDNGTILNALLIVICLADAVSRTPKAHNTGRPPATHRRGLSIYLKGMFRKSLGSPLTDAAEGLVSATFSGKAD